MNSRGSHQSKDNPDSSNTTHQRSHGLIPNKQDIFAFLQKEVKSSPSFFSENGLCQDILQVTRAEPDICLEAFYALYSSLWPQIEGQSDVSLKDAWTKFIGGSIFKGILCPPEKLITERRIRDIKKIFAQQGGEDRIFQDLDQVMIAISNLKDKIVDYPGQLLHKEQIIATLNIVQEFYLGFRKQVKSLTQVILEKEQMSILFTSESDALEDLLEPKAVMMSDIFPSHWAYRISRNQAQKLLSLDASGRQLESNLNDPANHRVISLPEDTDEPLVFFKANGSPSIQPEKEYMLYSLYRHLQIPTPETALLVLTNVFETNSGYFYAVQASEAVIGESPLKAYQNPETTFDHEAFSLQAIGAFLSNPSDGSFKNFKYSPEYQTFISIDNDLVFKPELTGKDDRKVVNVKSMIYLLPQIDLPIPEPIKTFLTTLDPHLTTLSWLQDLSQKNQEYSLLYTKLTFQKTRCIYQNLLPQSEVPSLATCLQKKVQVDPKIHGGSFYPQILLSKELLTQFIEKLRLIEKTLLTNRSVSPQVLFEEISPVLGKYYRKLRFEFNDPEEALEALWGNKKNDIDYSYISSMLDQEELANLSSKKTEFEENLTPEAFFQGYKDHLASGETAPLDSFIRRHNERKKKNTLNLHVALKELQCLVQGGLTNSQCPRDILEFSHSLTKMIGSDPQLLKGLTSLLSNLPHPELKWLLALERYFLRPDRHIPKDLVKSSVEVLGVFMKQRIFVLTESENQYLFDQQGNILKNSSLTGRSLVTYFPQENPEFYLKQYPEWPGYEFASILFMRLLGIKYLPYQDLLVINFKYPVLLTQKAHGNPLLRVWHDPQVFHNLDPSHTALLIIAAMLINPEDGKEDNFILTPDGRYLIPIDNDHCFLPSTFQKEGSLWNAFTVNTALQTKTLLFCLGEMYMPIPFEVKQHLLSINFDLLLTKWMTELDKLENKFNNLIGQNQRNKFLEQGTVLRIPFYKQFIHNIHWKAHKIQDILRIIPEPTPFDLLKAVEPFAARCYENSFKQGGNLRSRFKAATDQLYKKTAIDGSRMSILNTHTMMEIINISEKDLQNDVMFQKMGPIDALELLNQLIQDRDQKAIKEQELLCELDEKKQEKKWISLFGNPPVEAALKAFLANPKGGLVLKGSKLITSSRLTELFAQASNQGMRIRFLSLPESPLLAEKEIRILAEECPNLEYLNISGCIKLKQLITREGEWALLSRLEAKDCENLEKLVSFSPMKILQIETNRKIEIFVEKSTLDIFTISKKTKESTDFQFSFKKGENFQIKSEDSNFSHDDIGKSILQPQKLNEIKSCFQGVKITIGASSISPGEGLIDFIHELNFQNSGVKIENIQTIIMVKLIYLKRLDLSDNEIDDKAIEILPQGDWPLLETLSLSKTKMTAEGVKTLVNQTNWKQLKYLNLSDDQIGDKGIETLSKANWPLLETLNLSKTEMTAAGVKNLVNQANWTQLKHLNLSNNEIRDKGLEILSSGNWPLLEILHLKDTRIAAGGVEFLVKKANWPHLKHLDLSVNEICDEGLEIITQANWHLLEIIHLDRSKITKNRFLHFILNIKWPNLKEINFDFIGKNVVNHLLQKNWHLIKDLNLSLGKITQKELEVIVKNWKLSQLKDLNLSDNEICDEGLEILSQGDWPLLETLDVSKTKMTAVGVKMLVSQTRWTKLKNFNLSDNEICDEGVRVLTSANWQLIEDLNLQNIGVTTKGIEIFVNNRFNLPSLKRVDVSRNPISDEGLEILVSSDWTQLEYLNLEKTGITDQGIEILISKSHWPNLKGIDISENMIGDKGLEALSSGKWPLLEHLSLRKLKITGLGIKSMTRISQWPSLKTLDLSESDKIFTEEYDVLTKGKWPLLECLILKNTSITGLDLQNLLNSAFHWRSLKEIHFEGLDREEMARIPIYRSYFSKIFPNSKIIVS